MYENEYNACSKAAGSSPAGQAQSTVQPLLHTESNTVEEELWDDPSAFDPMEKQMSKSVRRAVAKACKHIHNSIEKRLDPLRNKKKRNREFKLPWCATAAIRNEDLSEINLLDQQVQNCHRDKINSMPSNIMGLVVKVLTRKEPEWHTDAAKAALLKESSKLMAAGVWDLIPIEKSDALAQHPNASFSRLF